MEFLREDSQIITLPFNKVMLSNDSLIYGYIDKRLYIVHIQLLDII